MIALYSEGGSDTEVCKKLKLPYKEFERRCINDPLFAELVTFGRLACKAWWLEQGRKAATKGAASQAFNFWYAFMKNQFGWADKSETIVEGKQLSTDELTAKISELKRKIEKKPANAEYKEMISGNVLN